jgi:hypothetical protein
VSGVDHRPTVLCVGSGLIYAAIIVMWALYFLPRWLLPLDENTESRSVEKFDHAMRILSRREPTPDQRYIVMPPKPAPAPSVPAARSGEAGPRTTARSTSRTPQPAQRRTAQARASIAIRRRRVLAALVLLTLVVAALTPVTLLPWWAPLLAVLAIVVDLAHLRVQAHRRLEVTRTRHAVRKRLRSRLHRADSAERLAEARKLLAERREIAESERVEAEWAAHEVARREAAHAAGWQPTPVPLPTYVTKPIAPRTARSIDLTQPGAWTTAQGQAAGAQSSSAVASEEIFDQTSEAGQSVPARAPSASSTTSTAPSYDDYAAELDEILERRRAVND